MRIVAQFWSGFSDEITNYESGMLFYSEFSEQSRILRSFSGRITDISFYI